MKKIITYLLSAWVLLSYVACNDEWEEEVYNQNIGLKAIINSEGVTNIYIPYEGNGEFVYQLPVIVGGSQINESDLYIQIQVDKDTLNDLNNERYKLREDLYYKELPEVNYEFPSDVCHIPAGEWQGLYDIKFKFAGLDLRYKWVLPLTIIDGDAYNPNPLENYRKALLRVMPYNDYSGRYSATNMQIYIDEDKYSMTVDERTLYVISENQCFFYAGNISEELIDREKYKISLTFNEDGTIDAQAVDPENEMGFEVIGQPTFTKEVAEDATYPYIEHHYTTIKIEYRYNDISTYEDYDIPNRVSGTMIMERRLDTLKPERDQIQW